MVSGKAKISNSSKLLGRVLKSYFPTILSPISLEVVRAWLRGPPLLNLAQALVRHLPGQGRHHHHAQRPQGKVLVQDGRGRGDAAVPDRPRSGRGGIGVPHAVLGLLPGL